MQATQVTFQASPQIVEAVLTLLNGFSKKDVQIIAKQDVQVTHRETIKTMNEQPLLSVEELYGSLKPYVHGYVSDEDIENAIAEGAIDSGMAGKIDG